MPRAVRLRQVCRRAGETATPVRAFSSAPSAPDPGPCPGAPYLGGKGVSESKALGEGAEQNPDSRGGACEARRLWDVTAALTKFLELTRSRPLASQPRGALKAGTAPCL